MSNMEAAESLPISTGVPIARIEMPGPIYKEPPLVLEVCTDDEGASFIIHGPFHERNLISEEAFRRREDLRHMLARTAFWERHRQQELLAGGLARLYRGAGA